MDFYLGYSWVQLGRSQIHAVGIGRERASAVVRRSQGEGERKKEAKERRRFDRKGVCRVLVVSLWHRFE